MRSTVLYVCMTVVIVTGVLATALMILTVDRSEIPEGWLALFFGFMGSSIAGLAALSKIDKVERSVNDLNNGRMDAKIRANVADVLGEKYIDPAALAQIEKDRIRRDNH